MSASRLRRSPSVRPLAAAGIAVATLGLAAPVLADESTTVVTFDAGLEGWSGIGSIESTGGNPGAHLHTVNPDTFGLLYTNATAPWSGDLSAFDAITISTDVLVESITFFGQEVPRSWVVEIRDFENTPPGYPWVSVWTVIGQLEAGGGWETFSVTIDDPSATDLPAGWGGTGAEDPDTFEPILPGNRTFADVLAGADEVVLTTFEPGFFYGFTAFDVRLDNLAITTVDTTPSTPEDIDGDGDVDFQDLLGLLAAWGPCPGCDEDVNGTGIVDFDDLLLVLAAWSD